MKLSRRIWDVVRSGLRSPRSASKLEKVGSSRRIETQLEEIGQSLARSVAREKRLRDDLSLAEADGRERDAIRLRRQLADLTRSKDELQAALDLIEARVEMERGPESDTGPASPAGETLALATSPTDAVGEEEVDLADRKARLSTPVVGEKRGQNASKTR
jgi:hypothetical protein